MPRSAGPQPWVWAVWGLTLGAALAVLAGQHGQWATAYSHNLAKPASIVRADAGHASASGEAPAHQQTQQEQQQRFLQPVPVLRRRATAPGVGAEHEPPARTLAALVVGSQLPGEFGLGLPVQDAVDAAEGLQSIQASLLAEEAAEQQQQQQQQQQLATEVGAGAEKPQGQQGAELLQRVKAQQAARAAKPAATAGRPQRSQRPGRREAGPVEWESPAQPAATPSLQRLFERIDEDFAPFWALGNITEEMVDQAYCTSREQGFRFQVIDGQLYVAGMSESFQSRLLNMQRQLYSLSQRWQLPDVDMMIEQSDWPTIGPVTEECPDRGPIIAPAKHVLDPNHAHVILAPDHTFGEWIEAGTLSWAEMRPMLEVAASDHAWGERSPILMFRGAPTGPTRGELRDALAHSYAASHNWHLDVKIDEEIHSPQQFKSMYQHCSHKYLLHLPGNSYSGRLKYLMACGSAVVWLGARDNGAGRDGANLTTSYQEFWYGLLKDGEHVLFTETSPEDNMAELLVAVVQALLENEGAAERMGRAARELLRTLLTPDIVQEYWYRVITQYAELQAFQPRLHPDAVPIEESMVSRRWIAHDRRTCPRCRPPPPP